MERLDFTLPEFTRLSWVSDLARETWQPRFQRIQAAWNRIEWLAVVHGVRHCALTSVSPEGLVERGGEWARHGLGALPLYTHEVPNYGYSGRRHKAEKGKPFLFRVVIGAPTDMAQFQQAWEANDQHGMGQLLGYPECCTTFFQHVWVDLDLKDTTWSMALATPGSDPDEAEISHQVEVGGPPEANILWRWMNLRLAPHLPCSFACSPTVSFGRQLLEVGRCAGYQDEMEWLLEVLSWPVEWSALHGIAEIKTPLLKVSTQTDATPTRYVVRRRGESYPIEGAQGLVFPYQQPERLQFSGSVGYQRGLENPIECWEQTPDWYANDNGFSSRLSMDNAHEPVLEQIQATLGKRSASVLDLGCGNGALLKKLCAANPQITPFGIDSDAERIAHAGLLLPEFAANFYAGSMFAEGDIWQEGRFYDLILLMPGRLLEVTPEQAETLKQRIREHTDQLVVYAYGDWIKRFGNLQGLVAAAGLQNLAQCLEPACQIT